MQFVFVPCNVSCAIVQSTQISEFVFMRVLRREIRERDNSGWVKLGLTDSEDVWHAYNLIGRGDRVTASTSRKVRGLLRASGASCGQSVPSLQRYVETVRAIDARFAVAGDGQEAGHPRD